MGNKWVEACLWYGQFYNLPTTRRYRNGLVTDLVVGRIPISICIAEKRPNHMKGRKLRRARIHNKDADALTCLRCYWIRFILVRVAVKHDVVGSPVVHLRRVNDIRSVCKLLGIKFTYSCAGAQPLAGSTMIAPYIPLAMW